MSVSEGEKGAALRVRSGMFFAIASALLVPSAYVVGVAYHRAWLGEFGLPPALFPQGFEDVMHSAYMALIVPAMSWSLKVLTAGGLIGFLLAWFVVLLIVMVAPRLRVPLPARVRHLLEGLKVRLATWLEKSELFRSARTTHRIATLPLWSLLFLFYLPLYGLIPALLGHFSGRSYGQIAVVHVTRASDIGVRPEFAILVASGEFPGVLCGALGCALLDGAEVRFVKWEAIEAVSGRRY